MKEATEKKIKEKKPKKRLLAEEGEVDYDLFEKLRGLRMELAKKDDIIVLCGKGHETTQETDGKLLPLDERQIIAEYINGS